MRFGYVSMNSASGVRPDVVARELEELGIGWLEEPFLPDAYEAYAELADTVDLTIAAGEQQNQQTMPMIARVCGVLFCGTPLP